ncbi:CAAX protease self-immunity-domain-containing protein [Ostreococcus tauri]|uniref:CAAX protease self-immunity-domain-containing protein n=1 Tax=Ostreococcus tauri TaxID=70448 RepID=A0A1Y5IAW4_OSTTA|nr:CAAX protease self-immunity-domain-containing protein [Ostreococcus tauri]
MSASLARSFARTRSDASPLSLTSSRKRITPLRPKRAFEGVSLAFERSGGCRRVSSPFASRTLRTRAVASGGYGEVESEPSEPSTSGTTWFERFLKLPSDGSAIWDAPWGVKTTVSVMVVWFCLFFIVGNAVFPFVAGALGFDSTNFTQRGLAVYSFCLDIAQMFMTGFVLRQSLRAMRSDDLLSKAFYVLLASVAAPVWEELIFRGFFFSALSAVISVKRAMIISSVVFAVAHLSLEQFLPLTFLGCLHCVVFVRTRNLLAPALVHSAWNASVLAGDFLPPLTDVLRAIFARTPSNGHARWTAHS